MPVDTVMVYKGDTEVRINKSDLDFWKGSGWSDTKKPEVPTAAKRGRPRKIEVVEEAIAEAVEGDDRADEYSALSEEEDGQ